MPITLALFDMAATTVDDTINGRPLVLQSFEDSLNVAHVAVSWDVLNAQRGKDKMEVFRTLLASHGGLQGNALEQTAQRLLEHFTVQLLRNVERLSRCLALLPLFASSSNGACSSPWAAVSRWR